MRVEVTVKIDSGSNTAGVITISERGGGVEMTRLETIL